MSIFQKDCPQCAAPNPVRAPRCACGYFFEAEAANGKQAATAVALQEEALYEDYLAARMVQAEAELEVARGNAAADPGNTYKAAAVLVAEQTLSALRAELRVQTQRTTELKKISRDTRPTAAPKPSPAPVVPLTKRAAAPAAIRPKAISAPVAKPAEAPKAKSAAEPTATFRRRQAVKANAVVRAARTIKVAEPVSTPKPVEARKPVAVRKATPKAKPAEPAQRIVAVPAVTLKPVAAPKPLAPAAKTVKPAPTTVAKTQDCPNCTAVVAANVERCRCGYSFVPAALEMPSLALDATTVAVLDGDTAVTRTPRRR